MAKAPKINKRKSITEKKFRRNLLIIPIFAFAMKIYIIIRIQGFDWYEASGGNLGQGLGELLDNKYIPPNAWYGADGENYIEGLRGLAQDGFLSQNDKLSYWPAGYPILMWPILEIFRGYFFMALAILQSLLYAIGSIWFVDELRRTRISKASYLVAIFFALNPTLSLNTIAVGYELPVVALSLIALAALLRYFLEKKSSVICFEVLIATISLTIATFMQPRLLIIAIVFFLLWALSEYKLELVSIFLVITFGSLAVAPAALAVRNNLANGFFAISTNLGITMQLGAGPEASGGYTNTREGVVECPALEGNPAEVDRALVSCVIGWYVSNPETGLKLFWNKSRFFWSPWFGPEANGTMARNPWIQIHPFKSTAQTQEGFNLIYGVAGKVVSWLWMCISLIFLIYGLIKLWKLGDLERLLALISGTIIFLNLVSSVITIGDHRFRIPSMGFSLFLQAFGLFSFLSRQNSGRSYQSKLVTWPGLLRIRKTTESS